MALFVQGGLPVKTHRGVRPIFLGIQVTFHIFGSKTSLKSIILSSGCEINDLAEHIRPLRKVNSLLHVSKQIEIVFSKLPVANIELGWLMN